ncbi:hypothetical protein A5736_20420 [Mycobacterium sp. SP-6446]|nr:hypothetical protein A5736_20420 [Mycobacterium sp. SP-6446]
MHTLKERSGAFDFPKEVVVCELHREQLSDPTTEWVLINDLGRRRLLVGPMLAELNEYILMEPISKLIGHMASRDFSHPEHTGYHFPLKVRARGGTEETLTLVIPFDLLPSSAEFLDRIAQRSAHKPESGDDQ